MALVIEDGTSKANSEAYADVADTKVQWDAWGYDYTTDAYTDDQIEQAIRLTALDLESRMAGQLRGDVTLDTQAMLFPRNGYYDAEGRGYDSDEIPQVLKDLHAHAGFQQLTGVRTLDLKSSGNIIRAKAGSVEVEYGEGQGIAVSRFVNRLMRVLLGYPGSGRNWVRLVRS